MTIDGGPFYQTNQDRNLKEISWIIYGLPLGAMFTFLGIVGLNSNILSISLIILGTIFWLPGLIVHFQYYQDNNGLRVRLSKESEVIEITTPTVSRSFNKSDIKEILVVCTHRYQSQGWWDGGNRLPWNKYGYTQIQFQTGEIINLTNLIIDQSIAIDSFSNLKTKKLRAEELFPTIKKKSNLQTTRQ